MAGKRQGNNSGTVKKKKGDGPPWWIYGVIVAVLLAIAGQFWTPPKRDVGKTGTKGKPAKKEMGAAGYLGLATRLAEMTTVAAALQSNGELDADVAKELDEELTEMETDIAHMESKGDTVARDLRSMVSVVRGTLFQQTANLTDEQVAKMENAYTYANPKYWDDYYKKTDEDERFDWYGSWNDEVLEASFRVRDAGEERQANVLSELLDPYLRDENGARHQVLMFGCGNSDMSEKMCKEGYKDIVNIDISEKLMDFMRAKHEATCPTMKWMFMNASAMTFDTASFKVILDKGTLDAIEGNVPLLQAAVKEVQRTLRPGGIFISVTFNNANLRVEKQLKKELEWSQCWTHSFVRPISAGTGSKKVYYMHVCEKP